MAGIGMDISGEHSQDADSLKGRDFDYVVTLCDHARETCPLFPSKTRLLHLGFDDLPKMAAKGKDEEEALEHYRRVRDEIRSFVERMAETLQ